MSWYELTVQSPSVNCNTQFDANNTSKKRQTTQIFWRILAKSDVASSIARFRILQYRTIKETSRSMQRYYVSILLSHLTNSFIHG
jgi:hypothetical protein